MARSVEFCVESSVVLDLHLCPPPTFFSSFARLSLVLSLYAMLKVNPRNKVGGKRQRAHLAGGLGHGGVGRRCKCIAAPLYPWPGNVCTCCPDQDGMCLGIALSRPVNGHCRGADHGAAGITQCSEGRHIVPPPLTRTHDLPCATNGLPGVGGWRGRPLQMASIGGVGMN
jgi:hypothetical protein